MYAIESKYGNDGFCVWVKILREIAVTNYHYLDLSKKSDEIYFSAKFKVPEEKLYLIINDLIHFGEFDAKIWKDFKVLWNPKFIESIQDAYSRRSNKCMDIEGLRIHLDGLRPHKRVGSGLMLKTDDNNPQSRVEYTKVKDTKADLRPFLEKWNMFAIKNNLAKISTLTQTRKSKIIARGIDLPTFDNIMTKIGVSSFLLGSGDTAWRVDFDFIFKNTENGLKILEGKYDDSKNMSFKKNNSDGKVGALS